MAEDVWLTLSTLPGKRESMSDDVPVPSATHCISQLAPRSHLGVSAYTTHRSKVHVDVLVVSILVRLLDELAKRVIDTVR